MEVQVTNSERFHERRAGALCAAVFDTVRAWDGVECGAVAGCPAFLVDDVPFAVVSDRGLALSMLSDADRERLRVRWSALTFDPTSGTADETGSRERDDERRGQNVGSPVRSAGSGSDAWPLVPVGGNDLVSLRRFVRLSYEGAKDRSA